MKFVLVLVFASFPQNHGQLKHMRKHSRDPKLRGEDIRTTPLLTREPAPLNPLHHENETYVLPSDNRSTPLNLLLVLTDQWRFSALGSTPFQLRDFGISTPELDAFAASAITFQRAFSANPVCTPSRASLLTGRFSHQHGLTTTNLALPRREQTLAELLRDGPWKYQTIYEGKWHLDGDSSPGFVPKGWRRHGFTVMEGFNRGHRYFEGIYFTDSGQEHTLPSNVFEPKFQVSRAIDHFKTFRDARRRYHHHNRSSATIAANDPSADKNTTATSSSNSHDRDAFFQEKHVPGDGTTPTPAVPPPPWFMMLSLGPPHDPFTPPVKHMNHQRQMRWRANVDLESTLAMPPKGKKSPKNVAGGEAAMQKARMDYKGYLGLCEAVDAEFGRLIFALDRYGFSDDTIVVFTSDHGDMMYGHGDRSIHKNAFFDESLRVPLLVRLPGELRRVGPFPEPVSLADLAPTLLGVIHTQNPPSSPRSSGRSHVSSNASDSIYGGSTLHEQQMAMKMSGVDLSQLLFTMPKPPPSLLRFTSQARRRPMLSAARKGGRAAIGGSIKVRGEEEDRHAAAISTWSESIQPLFIVSQGAMTAPLAPDHLRLLRLAKAQQKQAARAQAKMVEGGRGGVGSAGNETTTTATGFQLNSSNNSQEGIAGNQERVDLSFNGNSSTRGVGAFLDSGGSCGVMSYTVRGCGEWRAVVTKHFKLVVLRLLGTAETTTTSSQSMSEAALNKDGTNTSSSNKSATNDSNHSMPRVDTMIPVAHPAFLFDLKHDPFELHNAINDEELAGIKSKMLAHLTSWLERTKDPFPSRRAPANDVYANRETLEHPRSVVAGSVDVIAVAAMRIPSFNSASQKSGGGGARSLISTNNPSCWERRHRQLAADESGDAGKVKEFACLPAVYLSHAPFAFDIKHWQIFIRVLSRHPQVVPPRELEPDWWGNWMREEEAKEEEEEEEEEAISRTVETTPKSPSMTPSPPLNVALATLEEYLNNFQGATRSIIAAHERLADAPLGGQYTENGMAEKEQAQRKVGESSQADRESPTKTTQLKKQRLSFEEFQSRFGIGLEEDGTRDPKAAFNYSNLRDNPLVTADGDDLSTAVDSGFIHPENIANEYYAEEIGEANPPSSSLTQGIDRRLNLKEEAIVDKNNLEGDQSSSSISADDASKLIHKEVGDIITFDATPGTMFTYGSNDVMLAEVVRSIQPTAKFIFFSTASSSLASGSKSNGDVSFPQMSRLWNEFTAKLRRMRAIKSRSLKERPHISPAKQTPTPTTSDALLPEWLWSSAPSSVDSSEVKQESATPFSAIVLSFVESVETSLDRWDGCRLNNNAPDFTANASGTTNPGSSAWRRNETTQIDKEESTAAQCLKALTAGQKLYQFEDADTGHGVQDSTFSSPASKCPLSSSTWPLPGAESSPRDFLLLRERARCFGIRRHNHNRRSNQEASQFLPLAVPLAPWLGLEERILATWLQHFKAAQILVVDSFALLSLGRSETSDQKARGTNALARISKFLGLASDDASLSTMLKEPAENETVNHLRGGISSFGENETIGSAAESSSSSAVNPLSVNIDDSLSMSYESVVQLVGRLSSVSIGNERGETKESLSGILARSSERLKEFLVSESATFNDAKGGDISEKGLMARAMRLLEQTVGSSKPSDAGRRGA